MKNSNPTQQTQKEIMKCIQESKTPVTLTAIAKKTGKNLYQVKATIQFLEKLGFLTTIVSSGNTTLIIKKEVKNETTN